MVQSMQTSHWERGRDYAVSLNNQDMLPVGTDLSRPCQELIATRT